MQLKSQMKLNSQLKKAIHSSDEYEDYMTLVQFLVKEKSILSLRMARIIAKLSSFEAGGGVIEHQEGGTRVSYGDIVYVISYREDGSIRRYYVDNPDDSVGAEYCHEIFWCSYIRPYYADKIAQIDKQLADIDNDNVLKGIGEIRKLLRQDRYMTAAAISGTMIQSEEDLDPYGLFGGEE